MNLTPADISAIADQMAPMVARMVVQLMQGQQIDQPQPVLNEVERIKQQALQLAKQGKRHESIELMRSITSTRRASHA